ncbi:MAG: hypothetical protein KBA97_07655 [Methanothrix sp.]|nr:hypothetical protein [Methanothrix sp.]
MEVRSVVCRRDVIKAIRQGLSVLLLGMLIASVSAHERIDGFGHPPVAGYIRGFGYHDWLAPGGLVFSPVPALEHPPLYPAPIVEPPYYPEPAERGCCNPCDDCNPCTEDTCTPDGCVNAPINCDDGNPCTVDTCGPDGCMNIPVDCDDGNPCTVDSCGPNGCMNIPVSCDDGNPCTIDSCGPNGCMNIPVSCDDGNPCTIDSCGPNGCIHSPVAPPVDPLPESKCCEKSKPHIVKEVRPSVQAWRGAYWYNDIAMPKWPQLTETCVEVKSNEEIVYPWTGRHLGVDAWYGAFWYTKVFTPKWPQF